MPQDLKDLIEQASDAAFKGDIEALKAAINENPECIRQVDSEGITIAQRATIKNNVNCLKLIAEVSPDALSDKGLHGYNSAHSAAAFNNVECLQMIWKINPNILKAVNDNGETIAHSAASEGSCETLKQIIDYIPESLRAFDSNDETPAHYAASNKHFECLKLIADTDKEALSLLKGIGHTPAGDAVFNCNSDTLEILAQLAPESLIVANENDSNAITISGVNRDLDCLKVLIKYVPEHLTHQDCFGYTLANVACVTDAHKTPPRSTRFIEILAEHNPEILSIQDKEGFTPAMRSVINELEDTLKIIAEYAPESLKIREHKGASPLGVAKAKKNDVLIDTIRNAIGTSSEKMKKTPLKELSKFVNEKAETDADFRNQYLCNDEWLKHVSGVMTFKDKALMLFGFVMASGCLSVVIVMIFAAITAILGARGSFFAILPFIGILAFAGSCWYSKRFVKKQIQTAGRILANELGHLDYYFSRGSNAIGINIKERLFCVIAYEKRINNKNVLTFSADIIEGRRIEQPGYTTYTSNTHYQGSDLTSIMQATSMNSSARAEAERKTRESKNQADLKTGLFIETNDLDFPEVFVNMPYETADKWMKLIKKLMTGELEEQKTPQQFPKQ